MNDVTARGRLRRAVAPRFVRAPLTLTALCLLAVSGCGSEDEPRVQYVAVCSGSADVGDTGNRDLEFRQDGTVVARGSVPPGAALTVEVPAGEIHIYVDGEQLGTVDGGVDVGTDAPYRPPEPDDVTYLADGEGCPATAPPWPGEQPED